MNKPCIQTFFIFESYFIDKVSWMDMNSVFLTSHWLGPIVKSHRRKSNNTLKVN